MINDPLVSVIIPTFKRPKLLERAITSVLNQTYSNIEIIVVDDAQDSATSELVSSMNNVKLLINESNRGGCYSRNIGLKESKGEYVNFLDDDDILYPKKIEMQIGHFLKNPNNISQLGFITCHTNDGRTGKIQIKKNKVRGDIHQKLLSKFLIDGIETVLYKKEAIEKVGGFDEALVSNQEYDLQIRVSEFFHIDYVDEILTEEFQSVGQISINFDKKLKGARQIFAKHKARFKKQGIRFYIKLSIKYMLLGAKFRIAKLVGVDAYNRFLR